MFQNKKLLVLFITVIFCLISYLVIAKLVLNKVTRLENHVEVVREETENTSEAFYLYSKNRYVDIDLSGYWFSGLNSHYIPSLDTKTILHAKTKTGTNGAWVIIVHGIGGSHKDATVLTVASMLSKHGFSVMLLDMREHGLSTKKRLRHTGAYYEANDVIAAWQWLQTHQNADPKRIGVYGISFGSGVSAVAFDRQPHIKALWMDAPYADILKIMKSELQHANLPSMVVSIFKHASLFFEGVDVMSLSPLNAMKNIKDRWFAVSYYLFDTRTPGFHGEMICEEAKKNAEYTDQVFCKPVAPILKAPNGMELNHAIGPYVDPSWEQDVVGFFSKALLDFSPSFQLH